MFKHIFFEWKRYKYFLQIADNILYQFYIVMYAGSPFHVCMRMCARSALTFCVLLPCADLFLDMVPALALRLADLMWHHLVPGLA